MQFNKEYHIKMTNEIVDLYDDLTTDNSFRNTVIDNELINSKTLWNDVTIVYATPMLELEFEQLEDRLLQEFLSNIERLFRNLQLPHVRYAEDLNKLKSHIDNESDLYFEIEAYEAEVKEVTSLIEIRKQAWNYAINNKVVGYLDDVFEQMSK